MEMNTHTERDTLEENKSGHKKNAKFIHKPLSIQSVILFVVLFLSLPLKSKISRIARIATISVHLCKCCVALSLYGAQEIDCILSIVC